MPCEESLFRNKLQLTVQQFKIIETVHKSSLNTNVLELLPGDKLSQGVLVQIKVKFYET